MCHVCVQVSMKRPMICTLLHKTRRHEYNWSSTS